MISGVLVALFGEAVLFGSIAVFVWCATFFIANSVYFRFLEEPGLVRRFGNDYIEYRRNVPTWLPRLKPWSKDIDNRHDVDGAEL
jgi:protein-S-isoprenylcysteine O-methyltransferase Ste14